MRKHLSLIALLLGLVFLVGSGFLVQHAFHPEKLKAFQNQPWDPKLLLKNAVLVGWDHGERLWEFRGNRLVVDHQGHFLTYRGNGIGKLFYKNKPYLTVLAPEIRLDLINKGAVALHGVRLFAQPKTTLIAESLSWNQYSERLYIPGSVEIESPYGHFKANHLIFAASEGRLTMRNIQMALLLKLIPYSNALPFLKQ